MSNQIAIYKPNQNYQHFSMQWLATKFWLFWYNHIIPECTFCFLLIHLYNLFNQLTTIAQLTGFYIWETLVVNGLKCKASCRTKWSFINQTKISRIFLTQGQDFFTVSPYYLKTYIYANFEAIVTFFLNI